MRQIEGQRIGSYQIVARIGAGGMGEVYRARDLRLGRDVAIKVLPADFISDPDRLARFEREARMLAALNHPHIASIYGVEDADPLTGSRPGIRAFVLELVEGQTLAERLQSGPMPLLEALTIARQMAEALEAAHEKGIVHRDLKPANIKITPAGVVKVLDFGLAKAAVGDGVMPDLSQSPTITFGGTRQGVILGTTAYMSPEQARGQMVDQRTDVWAFGCVLFEMLAGRKPFAGDTVSDTIAAILEREPDWNGLPRSTPASVRHLLQRCLHKDAARRPREIAYARVEIEEVLRRRPRPFLTKRILAIAGTAMALVVAAGVGAFLWLRSDRTVSPSRADWRQLTNLDSSTQPALSPDGRMLAFIRGPNTFTTPGQIYIKLLPDGEPVQLTNDALPKMGPVFSPDGGRIAYTALDGDTWDTWIVPALRGEPRRWLRNASGLTWIGASELLFSEIKTGDHMAIVRSNETRAEPRDLYVPPRQDGMAHRSSVSPDGKQVLVVEMASGIWLSCRLMPIDGSSSRPVGPQPARCTGAAWAPDGTWMYFSADAGNGFHLWRQRRPDSEPEQITSGPTEEEGMAIAQDGRSLITSVGLQQRAVWVHDASGEHQISLEGYAYYPLFSADGRRVCFRVTSTVGTGQSPSELWVAELSSGRTERIYPGQMVTSYDVSRDDRVVAAVTEPDGTSRLWLAWLDGREPPRPILGSEGDNPRFGRNGEILFRVTENGSPFLFRIRENGAERQKVVLVASSVFGTISPDGEWLSGVGPKNEMLAYSTRGGAGVRIFPGTLTGRLRWDFSGQRIYVQLQYGQASAFGAGRTYALPLAKGSVLPLIPDGGFRTEAELAAVPGVEILPHADLTPGPSPEVYAFSRTTTTRNLHRIPLP